MKPLNFIKLTILPTVLVALLTGCTSNQTVSVFNGKDLTGWRIRGETSESKWVTGKAMLSPQDPKLLIAQPGGNAMINLTTHHGDSIDIYTEEEFSDARFELEVMMSENSNSGILICGKKAF